MIELGSVTITLVLDESGRELVGYAVEGDLGVVQQLGMLELTKDTILNPEEVED